mgnify:CR=1 FL=1
MTLVHFLCVIAQPSALSAHPEPFHKSLGAIAHQVVPIVELVTFLSRQVPQFAPFAHLEPTVLTLPMHANNALQVLIQTSMAQQQLPIASHALLEHLHLIWVPLPVLLVGLVKVALFQPVHPQVAHFAQWELIRTQAVLLVVLIVLREPFQVQQRLLAAQDAQVELPVPILVPHL